MDTRAFVPSGDTRVAQLSVAAARIDDRKATGGEMDNGAVAYAEAPAGDAETLTVRARVLIATVCGGGAAALVWAVTHVHTSSQGWTTFALLGAAAATAHLFPVRMRSNNAFSMAPAFVLPGIFLLPLPLALLLPVLQLLPAEALKERYRWYIVSFNTSNWTLDLLAAWGMTRLVRSALPGGFGFALAGFIAAATLIVLNHVFLSLVLSFARGYSIRSTGLLTIGGLAN